MTDNQSSEIRTLKMQVAKLQLESKLRRNLSAEIDKQKQIARNAEEIAKEKSREIEEIASQLSKYLSPQLFNSIFSGGKKVLIESEKKFLTVFFSDIVSFTSISDNMDSVPLTEMLNLYLTKMSEIALKYGGTIDKYIGDSVMIFFGDLASRLESSSPVGQILVSEKTRSLINDEIDCKKYDEIKVKGFKDKIGTFIPNF